MKRCRALEFDYAHMRPKQCREKATRWAQLYQDGMPRQHAVCQRHDTNPYSSIYDPMPGLDEPARDLM